MQGKYYSTFNVFSKINDIYEHIEGRDDRMMIRVKWETVMRVLSMFPLCWAEMASLGTCKSHLTWFCSYESLLTIKYFPSHLPNPSHHLDTISSSFNFCYTWWHHDWIWSRICSKCPPYVFNEKGWLCPGWIENGNHTWTDKFTGWVF